MHKQALETVLEELNDDYVHLFEITTYLSHDGVKDSELITETINLIKEAHQRADIAIGQFANGEFQIWKTSFEDSLKRIKQEWHQLNKPLNPGDICWLTKLD